MRDTVKLVIKYVLYGISLGCTFFVLMCLSYSLWGGEEILMEIFRDFTRQAAGAMLIGVACGGTAVVYQLDRPSRLMKIMIHFGVFYPTAVSLGWIPFHPERIGITVLQFLASCSMFVVIWLCFYLFHRTEARRINERLRELERENAGGGR